MGRPSLAPQRTEQILDGFERCIGEHGVEGSSLERIALQAGVQRRLIRHYLGNREDVERAAVERIVARYDRRVRDLLETAPETGRVDALLELLFGGNLCQLDPEGLLCELMARSHRCERTRALLARAHRGFEGLLARELRRAHPRASRQDAQGVAYTLLCLALSNADLLGIGFPRSRGQRAREAADHAVRRLEETT